MRRRSSPPRADEAGFVLVLTLLMLALISSAVVALLLTGKVSLSEANAVESDARRRAIVEAAGVRGAYSLRLPDDPVRVFRSSEREPALWRFEGVEVELFGQAESAKIDLNAGHGDLIAGMLRTADLDDAAISRLEESIRAARIEGRVIPSVRSLLRPCRRLGKEAAELERRFTVMTGLKGITPTRSSNAQLDLIPTITGHEKQLVANALATGRSPLDDRRLTRLRPFLSGGASVYSLVARLRAVGDETIISERRSALNLEVSASYPRLIAIEWGKPLFNGRC